MRELLGRMLCRTRLLPPCATSARCACFPPPESALPCSVATCPPRRTKRRLRCAADEAGWGTQIVLGAGRQLGAWLVQRLVSLLHLLLMWLPGMGSRAERLAKMLGPERATTVEWELEHTHTGLLEDAQTRILLAIEWCCWMVRRVLHATLGDGRAYSQARRDQEDFLTSHLSMRRFRSPAPAPAPSSPHASARAVPRPPGDALRQHCSAPTLRAAPTRAGATRTRGGGRTTSARRWPSRGTRSSRSWSPLRTATASSSTVSRAPNPTASCFSRCGTPLPTRARPARRSALKRAARVRLGQHGIMDSSYSFIAKGASDGLAFRAFDKGYDVFMGNFRGTSSLKHSSDHISARAYWDFTLDDHGNRDLEAFILEIQRIKSKDLATSPPRARAEGMESV